MEQYSIHNNVEIPPVRYGQPENKEPFADALMRLKLASNGKGPAVASEGLSYTGILRAVHVVSAETGRKFLIRKRNDGDYWVWRIKPR